MPDRPRPVPPAAPRDLADDAEGADRESRVEQLLLAGLDQYFAGHYEQAIDVWTRVAFLDRRNTRAKAYIDRARGLVAEQQREVEALVQEGVAAYQAGDLAHAKTLLTRAVDRGGHSDTAQLFLERLHRSDLLPEMPAAAARRAVPAARPTSSGSAAWNWLTTGMVALGLAGLILVAARPVASFVAELPIAMPTSPPMPADGLPVARPSDRTIAAARTVWSKKNAAEAIRLLESVDVADARRPEADALRAEIQRQVLASVQVPDFEPEAAR
jgi:hypothetical protein